MLSSFFLVFLSLLSLALASTRLLEHFKHEGARIMLLEEQIEGDSSPPSNAAAAKHNVLSTRIKGRLYSALGRYVPEAGLVMLVGIVAGWLMCLITGDARETVTTNTTKTSSTEESTSSESTVQDYLLQFSPTTFFLLLLPPIIFNSGYHMNRSLFYPLLPAISMYAILGTAISSAVIGVGLYKVTQAVDCSGFQPTMSETLAFGALISATDPVSTLAVFQSKRVDPTLFYLVFGESVLNDAVGLVMYETLRKFVGIQHSTSSVGTAIFDFCIIFVCSTLLGLLCGIAASKITKLVKGGEDVVLIECGMFSLVVYLPFLVAEVLSMSGIVTILFTGIMCKCYGAKNLTPESKLVMDDFFRILAHLAETAIFLQLGLSVFGLTSTEPEALNAAFVLITLACCLLARAVNVYPISYFLNRVVYEKSPVNEMLVKPKTQHMLYLSGLRGAVAFACAQTFPDDYGNRGVFVVTTMAVVLVTTFTMGGGTESMLEGLGIETGVDEEGFDGTSIPRPKWGVGGIKSVHEVVYRWTVGERLEVDLQQRQGWEEEEDGVEMEGRTLVLHDGMMERGIVEETPRDGDGSVGRKFFPESAGGAGVRSVMSVGSVGSMGSAMTNRTTNRRQRQHSRRDSSRNIFDFGARKTPTRDSLASRNSEN